MNTQLPSYEQLCEPLVPFSAVWIKWNTAKFFLNTFGRLSQGISLGLRSGFDSGQMLDYVYENKPRGKIFIGQFIDQFYLNSPGWSGIRQRKVHLKQILKEIINQNTKNNRPTMVMDVAAGPGQYLIETLQEHPKAKLQVLCRDLNEQGLLIGQKKSRELHLTNIRYEQADAFSLIDLRAAKPSPNVVVVSGLYELFTDDQTIKDSMKDIASILKPGDHFVVTNQPYHPQLELIARVLPNRLGQPWIMRLRSDQQIRTWAREAGFEPQMTLIDNQGIFSVSLMVRQ